MINKLASPIVQKPVSREISCPDTSALPYFRAVLLSALLLLCASALLVTSCAPWEDNVYRKDRIMMDTLISISVVSDSSDKAEAAIDKTFEEIDKLDKLVNFFSDKSELAKINANAGQKPVKVSGEMFALLEKAVYVSEKTGGAFDVTIGPEIALWDFHKKIKPDDKASKQKIHLVNYKNLILDKNAGSVFLKQKGMLIDLGGIAKGYAADRAVETLKNSGIKSGLVAVAGEIKAFGSKPEGKPWRIGIKNPRAKTESDEVMATLELTDMAISTSGDYERYFLVKGKRYHHILNPKTGRPEGECQSVSVMAGEGALTDPLSTGIFVLGHERGLKLLEEMGFNGLIVDKDGKIHMTSNLRGKIDIVGNSQGRKRNN